jgi:hypothetical protein
MKATYKFEESDRREWIYELGSEVSVVRCADQTATGWKSYAIVEVGGQVYERFDGARGFGSSRKADAWSQSRDAFDKAMAIAARITKGEE